MRGYCVYRTDYQRADDQAGRSASRDGIIAEFITGAPTARIGDHMATEPLIFDLSSPGRVGFSLPEVDMDEAPPLDAIYGANSTCRRCRRSM